MRVNTTVLLDEVPFHEAHEADATPTQRPPGGTPADRRATLLEGIGLPPSAPEHEVVEKLRRLGWPRVKGGRVFIRGEYVDVPAAFAPFAGLRWAVVATNNPPGDLPVFLSAADELDWEFRHSLERDGWTWLFFRRRAAPLDDGILGGK